MTRATVGEFNQQIMILAGNLRVTFQTETHIEYLRVFGNSHFAHITMTVLAVLSRGYMGTMIKLNKIRHLRNGYPLKGLAANDRVF